MINGYEYSFEDISLVWFDTLITGFVGHDYTSTKEHFNIHGRGADPVAMGRGKKDYSGTLVILQSEYEKVQAKLPKGKDLTDATNCKITTSYAPEGGVITTDESLYVRFTSVKKGMRTGDGNMAIELPYIAGKINYNV